MEKNLLHKVNNILDLQFTSDQELFSDHEILENLLFGPLHLYFKHKIGIKKYQRTKQKLLYNKHSKLLSDGSLRTRKGKYEYKTQGNKLGKIFNDKKESLLLLCLVVYLLQ